jgi:hypothetical protein
VGRSPRPYGRWFGSRCPGLPRRGNNPPLPLRANWTQPAQRPHSPFGKTRPPVRGAGARLTANWTQPTAPLARQACARTQTRRRVCSEATQAGGGDTDAAPRATRSLGLRAKCKGKSQPESETSCGNPNNPKSSNKTVTPPPLECPIVRRADSAGAPATSHSSSPGPPETSAARKHWYVSGPDESTCEPHHVAKCSTPATFVRSAAPPYRRRPCTWAEPPPGSGEPWPPSPLPATPPAALARASAPSADTSPLNGAPGPILDTCRRSHRSRARRVSNWRSSRRVRRRVQESERGLLTSTVRYSCRAATGGDMKMMLLF